jgi:uncharacterized membrane protein YgcG
MCTKTRTTESAVLMQCQQPAGSLKGEVKMYKCKLCGKVSSFRSDHVGHHCPNKAKPQDTTQTSNDVLSPSVIAADFLYFAATSAMESNISSSDSSSDSFSGGGGDSGGGGASSDF